MCHETLGKSLALIFQTCINKNTFPVCWKLSEVIPSFKERNKADVSSYRPAILLCGCSQAFEKVIFDVVSELVRKALHENQFGFRKRRSAILQFLLFLDKIYEDKDSIATEHLAVLYLDFAKAFDTVPHAQLINKLATIGISGKLLKLIDSNLSSRHQFDKINNSLTSTREFTVSLRAPY